MERCSAVTASLQGASAIFKNNYPGQGPRVQRSNWKSLLSLTYNTHMEIKSLIFCFTSSSSRLLEYQEQVASNGSCSDVMSLSLVRVLIPASLTRSTCPTTTQPAGNSFMKEDFSRESKITIKSLKDERCKLFKKKKRKRNTQSNLKPSR